MGCIAYLTNMFPYVSRSLLDRGGIVDVEGLPPRRITRSPWSLSCSWELKVANGLLLVVVFPADQAIPRMSWNASSCRGFKFATASSSARPRYANASFCWELKFANPSSRLVVVGTCAAPNVGAVERITPVFRVMRSTRSLSFCWGFKDAKGLLVVVVAFADETILRMSWSASLCWEFKFAILGGVVALW